MTGPSPCIGIDLGTTFTVVAHLDNLGRPCTVSNAEGDLTTPTAVFFDEGNLVVGKEALKAAALEPQKGIQLVKREMGNPVFSRPIDGEFFPPEVLQSLVLEKIKQDTLAKLGPFQDVVITVPAYFNEPRRKATQDAGRLAGLKVVDIINEPTAAAIAYGVKQGFLTPEGQSARRENILVYDLGGGTFDVSLMVIDGRNYTVVATDGDVKLGGADWDQRLADYISEQFLVQHGIDPRDDALGQQRLSREAEEVKRALTARTKTTVRFEHAGRATQFPLARQTFDEMTADLLERTRFTARNLLQQAGWGWDRLTRLVLVGGSTRMPQVTTMLERESGKPVDRSLAADEAVAHGAAIYAGMLQAAKQISQQHVKVTNVNAHTLGVLGIEVQTGRPRNQIMIPRNTPLPTTQLAKFQTRRHGQRNVVIKIVEGGDASGQHSTPIGRCVIPDLPPGVPAGTPVEVMFHYAPNGRLTVRARVPGLPTEAHLQLERASGLSDAELDEWGRRVNQGLRPLNFNG